MLSVLLGVLPASNESLMRASALVNDLISLPSAPSVKLLGNGPVASHDGLVDVTLRHPMHSGFHRDILPPDDFEHTRFYRWHLDAALYGKHPPRVTTLLCLTVPPTRMQMVRYDDGSGDTLVVPLATTAFVSSEYAFRYATAHSTPLVSDYITLILPRRFLCRTPLHHCCVPQNVESGG